MVVNMATSGFAATDTSRYYFRFPGNDESALIYGQQAVDSFDVKFSGIAGVPFNEIVPMVSDYQQYAWQVESGAVPAGLTFSSQTRSFSGTPTNGVANGKVVLAGYDSSGTKRVEANLTFSIFSLDGTAKSQYVSLYAHQGKFFAQNLTIPDGIVVDHWEVAQAAPDGMTYNGRYVQGTPTTPGQYPIFNVGYDYMGKIIFVYQGKMVVESGPTFDFIADNIRPVQYNPSFGCGYGSECATWYIAPLPVAKSGIASASEIRYSYEVANSQPLPATLFIGRYGPSNPQLVVNGSVFDFYSQRQVRLKAVDVDGTVGYSNWFALGSGGPQLSCTPQNGATELVVSGTANAPLYNGKGYQIPFGIKATGVNYALSSGQIPSGLSVDPATGVINGTPAKQEDQTGVFFTASSVSSAFNPVSCGPFHFKIAAQAFTFAQTGAQTDYRVNDTMNVTFTASGGVLPGFTAALDTANSNLPATVAFQNTGAQSWTLSGPLSTVADGYKAKVVFTNGDGVTKTIILTFNVKDNLKINDVQGGAIATSQYAPYDDATPAYQFTYANSTIGNPVITVNGQMPKGFSVQGDKIVGATDVAQGTYGPFTATLSDDTTQTSTTAPFNLVVGPRTGFNVVNTTNPVTLTVNKLASVSPLTYNQEPLAKQKHPLVFSISPALPDPGLTFDPSTGTIGGTPTTVSSADGFVITASETNGSTDKLVSSSFTITIQVPQPFSDAPLPDLSGNVNGPSVSSADPKLTLNSPRNIANIVGTVDQVTFLSATPSVPGLIFNKTTGVLSGVPTSLFDDKVTIAFQDSAGRPGNLLLPVKIWPTPAITTTQDTYSIPRLNDVSDLNISFTPNEGFFAGVSSWDYAPTSPNNLPSGLKIINGQIIGFTTDPSGSSKTVTIRATAPNTATADKTITLNVTPQVPIALTPSTGSKAIFEVLQSDNSVVQVTQPTISVSGGLKPYVWSLLNAPSWLAIDPATGALSATVNPPALGTSNTTLVVTDKENSSTSAPLPVKVTLSGSVIAQPDTVSSIVRQAETFKTAALTFSNKVGNLTFSTEPTSASKYLVDATNGIYSGNITTTGVTAWNLKATDADGRTVAVPYGINVQPPLAISYPNSISTQHKQYDPTQPVSISFAPAKNAIGNVTYTVSGVPGKVFYKTTDQKSQLATYTNYDNGISQIVQAQGDTVAQTEAKLPANHFVFDEDTLLLQGIPAASGNFQIYIAAHDDHEENGYKVSAADANKDAYENATYGPVNIAVAPAADLSIATNKTSDTIYQYTSQSTISAVVSNPAYGVPVTWSIISGTLPPGLTLSSGNTLALNGYPTATGTFSNIVLRATDAAGRSVQTDPITITVNARQPLNLVSSTSNPRYMVVSADDAAMVVSAQNTAYGLPIGQTNWTVSGANKLPPGVTYTVSDDAVTFSGKSDVIGVYSGISVSAVDSLGQSKTLNLTFNVIKSPDPIALNVSAITTKIGFPVSMTAPYAAAALTTANTYGNTVFSSPDAASFGLAVDPATGSISGNATATGQFTFNLAVKDDTGRTATKPVNVTVTPVMRVLVPAQLTTYQTKTVSSSAVADYALGAVTYAKGQTWPAGLTLDSQTGAIGGTITASVGTYSGLTVIATDAVGDQQSSNAFALTVQPAPDKPAIANVTNNKLYLGNVGQSVSYTPTVNISGKTGSWTTSGNSFAINVDVTKYGLSFDTATGTISGTPTATAILTNTVITVTSVYNDTSSTTPFTIYIAPSQAMAFNDKVTDYSVHTGVARTLNLSVANALGNVAYTTFSRSSAQVVPVYDNTNTNMSLTVGTAGSYTLNVQATDEPGRTVTKQYNLTAVTLAAQTGLTMNFSSGKNATQNGPAMTGVLGTLSYQYSSLPVGLTYDQTTGVVSGNSTASGTYTINYTITDSFDGATVTGQFTLNVVPATISNARFWRIAWSDPNFNGVSLMEFQVWDNNTNTNWSYGHATLLLNKSSNSWNNSNSAPNTYDNNNGTGALLWGNSYVTYDFGSSIPNVKKVYYNMAGTPSNITVYYATDTNFNWIPAGYAPAGQLSGWLTIGQ